MTENSSTPLRPTIMTESASTRMSISLANIPMPSDTTPATPSIDSDRSDHRPSAAYKRDMENQYKESRKKWRKNQFTQEYLAQCRALPTIAGAEHHPPIMVLKDLAPPKPYPPQNRPLRKRLDLHELVTDMIDSRTKQWKDFLDQDMPTMPEDLPPLRGFSFNPFTETDIVHIKTHLNNVISEFLDSLLIIDTSELNKSLNELISSLSEYRQTLITTMLETVKLHKLSRQQKTDLRFNIKMLFRKSLNSLIKARDIVLGPDHMSLNHKINYLEDSLYRLTFVAKPQIYLNISYRAS